MICFEITESSAIANIPNARRLIDSLRELGCRFSLDDFGTGMVSFAYLQQLSVDYVKIDGSFVKEIRSSPVDGAIVEMIVRVTRVAGKNCIAEFAESEEILHLLREIGVYYAQGYAIGRPQPFNLGVSATGRKNAGGGVRLFHPRHALPRPPSSAGRRNSSGADVRFAPEAASRNPIMTMSAFHSEADISPRLAMSEKCQKQSFHSHMRGRRFHLLRLGRNAAATFRGSGGESGIRTHGTVSRTHAFQACALSHSAISPEALS